MLLKKDPDAIRSYLEDSSNFKGGRADLVAAPEDINELSRFLSEANSKNMPVTISGGGTTTTGSRIPLGGAVVSLERLNKIISVSSRDMSAVVQAGVTVDDLKAASDRNGLFYTSHPTEGTAFVGGTASTNASGSRSFKYGPTRDYVKRLKMVLADGEIVDLKRAERYLRRGDSNMALPSGRIIKIPLPSYKMPNVKSAAGYFARDGMDLIDLFIGQEGTLSVIAELEVGLVKKPAKIFSAFVFFPAEENSWNFAADARDLSRKNRVSPGASIIDALSIEYFGAGALSILRKKNANVPAVAGSAIFFEQEVLPGGSEEAVIDEWSRLMSKHGASLDNTWVAMNEAEARKFTALRHDMPEAVNEIVRRNGFRKLSTDIAVPDSGFREMMGFYKSTFAGCGLDTVVFGHIGENHVHGNILPRSIEEFGAAEETVMKLVKKGVSLGGTVSAEHGIGKIKHKYLEEMYGTSGVLEMSNIKKALDPNCILGRDNIFSSELLNR
ncbi:MAG: FAD-binding oxidoreductase [Candidatus Omnitrophica bacterium]|nr:FAD-binding oxidoreductase [Candidatus Omnitrophota bacterium]